MKAHSATWVAFVNFQLVLGIWSFSQGPLQQDFVARLSVLRMRVCSGSPPSTAKLTVSGLFFAFSVSQAANRIVRTLFSCRFSRVTQRTGTFWSGGSSWDAEKNDLPSSRWPALWLSLLHLLQTVTMLCQLRPSDHKPLWLCPLSPALLSAGLGSLLSPACLAVLHRLFSQL